VPGQRTERSPAKNGGSNFLLLISVLLFTYSGNYSLSKEQNALTIEFVTKRNDDGKKCKRKYRTLREILDSGELKVCIKGPILSRTLSKNPADKLCQKTDIDFAKNMAITMGVSKLTFVVIHDTYNAVVDSIVNGDGDIGISNLSYTKERSQKVQFSLPYIDKIFLAFLVDRKLLENPKNVSLLSVLNNADVTIGATTNTCYQEMASKLFPAAKLKTEDNWWNDVVQDCVSGNISATIGDELRIKLLIQKKPFLLFRFIPIILKDKPDLISAVINLENTALLEWTNTFIRNGCITLSVDDILKKDGESI
jgi:hypothetical protein